MIVQTSQHVAVRLNPSRAAKSDQNHLYWTLCWQEVRVMASAIDMPFRHYTTVWRPRRTYVIYNGSTALTRNIHGLLWKYTCKTNRTYAELGVGNIFCNISNPLWLIQHLFLLLYSKTNTHY